MLQNRFFVKYLSSFDQIQQNHRDIVPFNKSSVRAVVLWRFSLGRLKKKTLSLYLDIKCTVRSEKALKMGGVGG